MRISEAERERLTREVQFAVQKMNEAVDPFDKAYFFSAAYGEAGRVLNTTWDPELALVHLVLRVAHDTTRARLEAIATGRERGVKLPGGFFDALIAATSELADIVARRRDPELYQVLARLAELAYLTTGNGYYLYTKGAAKPRGV